MSKDQAAPAASAPELVRKLSSMISAGVGARQAWSLLAQEIVGIDSHRRDSLEILWATAIETGGPVAPAISRLADVFTTLDLHQNQLQLAYAAPRATARLIFGLPFVGLALAQLLGLNPLGSMVTTLPGFLALCLGVILMLVASIWSRHMLLKAAPNLTDPGLFIDCVVVGLRAGLPVSAAISDASGRQLVDPPQRAAHLLEQSTELSDSTGAELTNILEAAADSLRAEAFGQQSAKVAKLSVHLMIPLGIAVLPAFVLLTVVPTAIGLLG